MEGCQPTNNEFKVSIFRKSEPIGTGDFYYALSLECVNGEANPMVPEENPEDSFFIQEDGYLYVANTGEFIDNSMYCVDYASDDLNTIVFLARVCWAPNRRTTKYDEWDQSESFSNVASMRENSI
ncbi:hypothetical protein Trydic_g8852 [Trypoxylus dichotomus]